MAERALEASKSYIRLGSNLKFYSTGLLALNILNSCPDPSLGDTVPAAPVDPFLSVKILFMKSG